MKTVIKYLLLAFVLFLSGCYSAPPEQRHEYNMTWCFFNETDQVISFWRNNIPMEAAETVYMMAPGGSTSFDVIFISAEKPTEAANPLPFYDVSVKVGENDVVVYNGVEDKYHPIVAGSICDINAYELEEKDGFFVGTYVFR